MIAQKVYNICANVFQVLIKIDILIGKKRKAFLDLLLDISENEKEPMHIEEIRQQVDVFMFAVI